VTARDPASTDAAGPGLIARIAATIPGPVFMRELNAAGRRTWTYVTRGLFVLGLAGIMGLVFLSHLPAFHASPSGLAQVQSLQGLAPTAASTLVWFLFVTLTLAAASQCGGAICDERRKGSLASLLTTPLAAWEIVMGKLLAGLAEMLLLSLASLPLLLAVRVFGGLGAEAVFASFALMIPSIILTASFTILASIRVKHAATAMIAGLACTGALWLLPPLLSTSITGAWGNRLNTLWWDLVPPFVLGRVTVEMIFGRQFGPAASVPWVVSSLSTLAAAAAVLGLATVLLRRTLAREASGPTLSRASGSSGGNAPRSRIVSDQPVLWRELHVQRGRRRWRIARWAIVIVLLAAMWSVVVSSTSIEPFYPVAIIGCILCLIAAATATTGSIAAERESRTLDSLLSTPLTPADIVRGKFFGAVRHLWFWPGVITGHYLVMGLVVQAGMLGEHRSPWPLLAFPLILLPPMAALCASGILFSGLIRKTSTATTVNICAGIAAWAGLPIVGGIVISLLRAYGNESLMGIVLMPNPVMHIVAATQAGVWVESHVDLADWPKLSWPLYLLILCVYAGAYAAITWGLLAAAWSSRAWTGGSSR